MWWFTWMTFFVCGPDFLPCKATYDDLTIKLHDLGFQINWEKVVDPCQQLVFLGIQVNTMTGRLTLKPEKLSKLCGLLHTFWQWNRASYSQPESWLGKLCWASHVEPWGRTHLRSIYVLLLSLKSPTYKCRLVAPGGIIGSTMGKTGDIFGPQPVILMYLPMPIPMVAEDSVAITCFMRTGPMMFHVKHFTILTPNHHVVVFRDNRVTEAAANNGTARTSTFLHILLPLHYNSISI